MKLDRHRFLRAIGLAGLPDGAFPELVDLTGLNVEIVTRRPFDWIYSGDNLLPLSVRRGPAQWAASVLASKREFDAIGLFPQKLHDLMRIERLYRFAVPSREQRFEGLGILNYLRYDEGLATDPRTVTIEIKGAGPLLVDIYP